jgi:cell division protein FtsQ
VPHRRLILSAGALLVAVALVVWLVGFSSVFGVKTVTVRGATTVTPAQVIAAARIKSGTPLVRLPTGAVQRRVAELPAVATVAVSTHYPSTVVITITERVAVGYLASGGRYTLLDKTGYQFRTTRDKPTKLPLFSIPGGAQARAAGQAVATVAGSLPRSVLAKVASIQAFDPTAITLLLTDHRVVRWGSADRSADKAQILPALLTQPGTQIDVTDPDQPFTR